MSYEYDPDLEDLYSTLRGMKAAAPSAGAHDVASVRQRSSGIVDMYNAIPLAPGVERQSFTTKTPDGHDLELVWYAPERATTTPGPALLQIHGGGFIAFGVHDFHPALNNLVAASGVPMLCVDYRLAPENPYPVPLEDCYTALTWLRDHAAELQLDPARIGVIGDSAGGGLAAGLALLARDRKFSPPLAKQVLMAPMLDDRIAEYDERLLPLLTFTYADKTSSWTAYVGRDGAGTERVPPYAAPGRESDLASLPSTYIDGGQLDVFMVEGMVYAKQLAVVGVSTEYHLYPGVPHAFDVFAPAAEVTKRAMGNRIKAIQSF